MSPAVVAKRKEEKAELSIEAKGTLEKARRIVRATTSVVAGPRGTWSVAKSPGARLASWDPSPAVPAVMPVCEEKWVKSAQRVGTRGGRDAHSNLCDIQLRDERGCQKGNHHCGTSGRTGKAKGSWNFATVLSVENDGAQGSDSLNIKVNELRVMLLITSRSAAAG
jgi:hypothetical protein